MLDNQGQPGKHFVIIRKALPGELDQVCELNEYLNSCSRTNFDPTMIAGWSQSEAGRSYFEERLADPNGLFIVAVDVDKFVGYLNAVIRPLEAHRVQEKAAELENIMVKPELQKKGIGKKMYEIFVNWCREQQVTRIGTSVYAKNTNAIEFYRHIGFTDYDMRLEMVVPAVPDTVQTNG